MTRVGIGLKIRERRTRLGITQSDMAKRIGISPSYLNLIESNKRNIAPRLIDDLARNLDVDRDWLDGDSERRLLEELREVSADPLLRAHDLTEAATADLVARNPAWAHAMVALYRAYLNRNQSVAVLSDRLNQDPYLGEAVHTMLTKITTIRSTAEILDTVPDIEEAQRQRFQATLASESTSLSGIAEGIAQFFDTADTASVAMTPAEEADDFIVDNGNYFADLETAADDLRARIDANNIPGETQLIDYLRNTYGVSVRFVGTDEIGAEHLWNQVRFDRDSNVFAIADNATLPRYRFQLARLVCMLALGDTCARLIASAPQLRSDEGRDRAMGALASYGAACLLMPYDTFLETAVRVRYDIEHLARRFGASYEQVCHRTASLKRPGSAGVPFAFMRTDPAGFITKRMPLPHLPLPRYGNACPLWAVYLAFQTPGQISRQIAEFPNGERFLFMARAQDKRPQRYNEPRHLVSVMIACDVLYADRTVYADGLDLGAASIAAPVGPSCRVCSRRTCDYREELQIQQVMAAGG